MVCIDQSAASLQFSVNQNLFQAECLFGNCVKNLETWNIYTGGSVIHFENGHHGSSGPLLIRTMSPNPKTMSPNFILQRNIKQAGKCSKGRLLRVN